MNDDGQSITSGEARILGMQLASVQSDTSEMKTVVGEINKSLQVLVRLEAQYAETRGSLTRAFEGVDKTNLRVDALEARLRPIEVAQPGLQESRGWIIAIAGAAVGMMLIAIASLVLHPTVVYAPPAPAQATVEPHKLQN